MIAQRPVQHTFDELLLVPRQKAAPDSTPPGTLVGEPVAEIPTNRTLLTPVKKIG
jgi:hypothetical protein